MVKVKESNSWVAEDGSIDVLLWIRQLGGKGYFQDLNSISSACTLSQLSCQEHVTETGVSCLQLGLEIADILADLEVDTETLIASIIFVSVHYAELSLEDVEEQLGPSVA